MLLKKFEENWFKVRKIGIEAEERAKALGLKLTWPTEKPEVKKREPKEPRHHVLHGAEKR